MPKKESGGCCGGGRGKFWWGVLAGLILAVALHAAVMMGCCKKSMSDCPMARGTAQAEKGAPAR